MYEDSELDAEILKAKEELRNLKESRMSDADRSKLKSDREESVALFKEKQAPIDAEIAKSDDYESGWLGLKPALANFLETFGEVGGGTAGGATGTAVGLGAGALTGVPLVAGAGAVTGASIGGTEGAKLGKTAGQELAEALGLSPDMSVVGEGFGDKLGENRKGITKLDYALNAIPGVVAAKKVLTKGIPAVADDAASAIDSLTNKFFKGSSGEKAITSSSNVNAVKEAAKDYIGQAGGKVAAFAQELGIAGEGGGTTSSKILAQSWNSPLKQGSTGQTVGERAFELYQKVKSLSGARDFNKLGTAIESEIASNQALRDSALKEGSKYSLALIKSGKDASVALPNTQVAEDLATTLLNSPTTRKRIVETAPELEDLMTKAAKDGLTLKEADELGKQINAARRGLKEFSKIDDAALSNEVLEAKNALTSLHDNILEGMQSKFKEIKAIDPSFDADSVLAESINNQRALYVLGEAAERKAFATNTISSKAGTSNLLSGGADGIPPTRQSQGVTSQLFGFLKDKMGLPQKMVPDARVMAPTETKSALDALLGADQINPMSIPQRAGTAALDTLTAPMTAGGATTAQGLDAAQSVLPQSMGGGGQFDPLSTVNIPDSDEPSLNGQPAVDAQGNPIPKQQLFPEEPKVPPVPEGFKSPATVGDFLKSGVSVEQLGVSPETATKAKILLTGDPAQQREGLYLIKKEKPEYFEQTKIPGFESIIDGVIVDPQEMDKAEIKAGSAFSQDLKRKADVIDAVRTQQPLPKWSYKYLGGEEQKDFVDAFLEKQEGGLKTSGYWGGNEKSGVTVGAGVDLGQWRLEDLQKVGIKGSVLAQVYPYLGVQGSKVKNGLDKVPLKLSEEDARELTEKVKLSIKNEVGEKYRELSGKPIDELPVQAQAVIYSLGYNYGTNVDKKQAKLFGALTDGDWGTAAKLLTKIRSNPELKSRRIEEANLLLEIAVDKELDVYEPAEDVKNKVQIAGDLKRQSYNF